MFSGSSELVEDILYPGALESRAQIGEDISEMREQLRKQVARLRELRVKKIEEPGMKDNNLLVAFFLIVCFRCILRCGRRQSTQCRCDDRCINAGYRIYSVYCSPIYCITNFKVGFHFLFCLSMIQTIIQAKFSFKAKARAERRSKRDGG